jgi:hypothetical protein
LTMGSPWARPPRLLDILAGGCIYPPNLAPVMGSLRGRAFVPPLAPRDLVANWRPSGVAEAWAGCPGLLMPHQDLVEPALLLNPSGLSLPPCIACARTCSSTLASCNNIRRGTLRTMLLIFLQIKPHSWHRVIAYDVCQTNSMHGCFVHEIAPGEL